MQRVAHNKDSRTKAIQYIMDHGGNINIQNKYGDTLLHLAVKRNDIDVVQFLLGAYNVKGLKEDQLINLSLRNQMGRDTGGPGKTALELAQDLRFIEIQELIANAAAENQKLLTEFAPAPQAENAERK
jgi:ankyrin repeat protein